ncbi:hypothetical protein GGR58DRAFT_519249 [Xylaria digitata]|nr:hypothetical protein GGR58DRAFT_519249 [Xylaria digitata]
MTTDRNLGFDVNAPGTSLFVLQLIFLVLAWVTSLMRAFVKLVILRKVTIDDYLMLVALLGYTTSAALVFVSVIDGGLGKPSAELSPESAGVMLKGWIGNMAISGLVSGLARASIALFLLRIAVVKWHRLVLLTIISVTAVMTAAYFFLVVFQCSPPSYFWDKVKGASGSCSHGMAIQVATLVWGSFAAAMDWILGLLPISILWNVRINRQSKVGVAAILSFGIISGIALIIRLVYVQRSGQATKDPEDGIIAVGVSAIVELALGIIAGCIATLQPLFKKMGLLLGSNTKRLTVDTIPWQRSFTSPENVIMMSPRRLDSPAREAREEEVGTRRPRPISRSAKRVLSSSNWDIDVEVAGAEDENLAPPPSGKVHIHTMIHVSSQPSDGNLSVSTVDFADKPLPPPPPRLAVRDRSIPRSRRLTPNLF